ncbi:MAG: tetratricopeptide repeat protein [Flavobacteriales bacterium]|nr:tetratricopeptide repeat protein [Flavobacteriales bacterium]
MKVKEKKIYYSVLIFLFSANSLFASNQTIDSLLQALQKSKSDKDKIEVVLQLASETVNTKSEEALRYANDALKLAQKIENKFLIGRSYQKIGECYLNKADYQNAQNNLYRSITIYKQLNEDQFLAETYTTVGNCFYFKGDYLEAINWFIKCKEISEKIKNNKLILDCMINIGLIYNDIGQYEKAMVNFEEAVKIAKAKKDNKHIAVIYNSIGLIKDKNGKLRDALSYYKDALQNCPENEFKLRAQLFNNIGGIMNRFNARDTAEKYLTEALLIRQKIGDKFGMAQTNITLSRLMYDWKKFPKAKEYALKGISSAEQLGMKEIVLDASQILSNVYLLENNYQKAFDYYKRYILLKDSLYNTSSTYISQLEEKYESERKESQIKQLELNNQLQQSEISRKQSMIYFSGGILVVIAILTFVLYSRYQLKNKANNLLTLQKQEIEAKNKEIVDSINYAQKIQQALLTNKEVFTESFKDSFIFFKPRDIVSGDFYWAHKTNDNFYFAVADCTGHGVPGAFMSLLGINYINQIVNEMKIQMPNEALNVLREKIVVSLKSSDPDYQGADGMDISLGRIDVKSKKLYYASANHKNYIAKNGEILTLQYDNIPVGNYFGHEKPFNLYTVDLAEGDTLYFSTDGYADQFGGETGKKFKTRNLKKMLSELSYLPMIEQFSAIQDNFEKWKGEYEQLDDICIIGVKI